MILSRLLLPYIFIIILVTIQADNLNDELNRRRREDSDALVREKRMEEVAVYAELPELNRVKRLDPLMTLHDVLGNRRVRRMVEDPSLLKRSIHSMAQLQKDAKMKRIKKMGWMYSK